MPITFFTCGLDALKCLRHMPSTKVVYWTTAPHPYIITSPLPLTTRSRNFQQYRTGFSSRRRPRAIAVSLRKHVGCLVSRQAHAPSTRPATSTVAHTPGVEGGRRGSTSVNGEVEGAKKGSTAMPLADVRCNLCNTCDGGIIILAVPSSRQGVFIALPPTPAASHPPRLVTTVRRENLVRRQTWGTALPFWTLSRTDA